MLSLVLYANNATSQSVIDAPSSNSTEDVLDSIRSLRKERSEDIQDKIIDNLHSRKPAAKEE